MKWVSLILQFIILNQTFHKQRSAIAYAKKTATKVKGVTISVVGMMVATLFLLFAVIVAVLDYGIQLDRQGHVGFSGLMQSALIFLGIAGLIFFVSLIPLLKGKVEEVEEIEEEPNMLLGYLAPFLEDLLPKISEHLKSASTEQPKENPPS